MKHAISNINENDIKLNTPKVISRCDFDVSVSRIQIQSRSKSIIYKSLKKSKKNKLERIKLVPVI